MGAGDSGGTAGICYVSGQTRGRPCHRTTFRSIASTTEQRSSREHGKQFGRFTGTRGERKQYRVAEQAPLSETEESVTTQSTANAEGTADSSLPLEQTEEDHPADTVSIEPSTESQDENTSSQVRRSSRVTKPPVRYM